MLCMEEKAVSEVKARGRIARIAAWFVRLPVAVQRAGLPSLVRWTPFAVRKGLVVFAP